jgi:phage-related protein
MLFTLLKSGKTHHKAKPFKGYAGVMEIVAPFKKETCRAAYALQIGTRVYVLHAFRKKSKQGIKTHKPELELIEARYKSAKRLEEENV